MCRDMMIQENLTISGAVREGAKRLKQCGIENADYEQLCPVDLKSMAWTGHII